MKKFECQVCHYVAEGEAPEVCPVCKQSGKFQEIPALKGSKTEANLWTAFAGESQARNKYTYFASVAKKAGYEQIAEIFLKDGQPLFRDKKKKHKKWDRNNRFFMFDLIQFIALTFMDVNKRLDKQQAQINQLKKQLEEKKKGYFSRK